MTEVKAKLKFLRQSPRKVRLVADLVRGKNAKKAVEILSVTNKKAATPMRKLIESAIANAKNNFNLEEDGLIIGQVMVDDGPTLKRWTPRARGRATTIRKRTSHIMIVITTKQEIEKKEEKKPEETQEIKEAKEIKKIEKNAEKNKKIVEKKKDKKEVVQKDESEIKKDDK